MDSLKDTGNACIILEQAGYVIELYERALVVGVFCLCVFVYFCVVGRVTWLNQQSVRSTFGRKRRLSFVSFYG